MKSLEQCAVRCVRREERILEVPPLTDEQPAMLLCAKKGRTMHLWRAGGGSRALPSHPYQDSGSPAHFRLWVLSASRFGVILRGKDGTGLNRRCLLW